MASTNSESRQRDREEIIARYRLYCDACQSSHLEKLKEFWQVPAMFTIDPGAGNTIHQIVESSKELEKLYGIEFGATFGVDQTVIDHSEIKFFGDDVATIETSLRHLVKGALHDTQIALYGCRKIEGKWWFISHISHIQTEQK